MTIRDGASEDDIWNLPKYRFRQSNVLGTFDNDKKQEILKSQLLGNNDHINDLVLHPEDSVSTIILSYLFLLILFYSDVFVCLQLYDDYFQ